MNETRPQFGGLSPEATLLVERLILVGVVLIDHAGGAISYRAAYPQTAIDELRVAGIIKPSSNNRRISLTGASIAVLEGGVAC